MHSNPDATLTLSFCLLLVAACCGSLTFECVRRLVHARPLVLLFLLQSCGSVPTTADSVEPLVDTWQLTAAAPMDQSIPAHSFALTR